MGKYPIYAFVALFFIGIIKLLQVTAFDVEKYNKNKKLSFAKPEKESTIPYKKEGEEAKIPTEVVEKPDNSTPIISEDTANQEQSDELDESFSDSATEDNTSENPTREATRNSYGNLSELKNLYLAPKIANLPPGQLREDVVIRYYRHDQDDDKVYVLKELGYYIHEKEANETAGLGSNVLYYGDDVKIEDIQIVAYTLLEKGLPIKAIIPTQFSWKSNSIEIGTDTLLLNNANLSRAEIQNFSK
ncbi:hypothetical protein [Ekhidna sp. To15]|uniref:hypothetical protein n=1 Tax=Ekhidna sp. To15 TaxID=3395267 RepID=UPI003F51C3C7